MISIRVELHRDAVCPVSFFGTDLSLNSEAISFKKIAQYRISFPIREIKEVKSTVNKPSSLE